MKKKYLKIFKSLILAFKYLFFKQPSKLSDTRLLLLLRQKVHSIEKGLLEKTSDFVSIIWIRGLYSEALKRNILSKEEDEWCKRVLIGKQIKLMNNSNKGVCDEFTKIIKGRRSIRSWKPGKLKKKEFEQLVDSARWAPSSCNKQPCFFILTRDKKKIKLLCEARDQKFIGNSPNCILVLVNTQMYTKQEVSYTPYLDAAAAIQNLLLKAQTLGLGACWVNFGTKDVPSTKRRKVKSAFNIPSHYEIISIIPIGIPKYIPLPPGRKNIPSMSKLDKF